MEPQQEQPSNTTVRWSWGKFPNNRIDGTRMIIPLGCLYTPLASEAPLLQYEPLRCVCGGCLSPHCLVDHRSKTWQCVICMTRNNFPAHYANMTEQQLPMELHKEYETVEYTLPAAQTQQSVPPNPTMVLVVDTCVSTTQELDALRQYLLRALNKIPENCNIALITYGATVQLHELKTDADFPRSLVLRGSTEATTDVLKRMIPAQHTSRYVCPLSDAEFQITSLIEEMEMDLWPAPKDYRSMRCTGAAISVAASLLEMCVPHTGSMILAFLSGVCTEGPGAVVDLKKENMIRGHPDIRDGNAPFYDKANQFYDNLMRRMVPQGHSLSLFVSCLDQTGLAEMKTCVQASGGMIISADSWVKPWIKKSLDSFFQRRENGELHMALNGTLDILTSPSWKIMGVIGCCIGTGRSSNCIAETEIGMGGTCQWTTSMLDSSFTFSAFFETANPPPNIQQQLKGIPFRFAQFVLKYQSPNGGMRLRVTTVKHAVQEQTNFTELATYFDQQCAAALMARIAVHKTDTMALFDVLRWLDRHTIRLVSRFGDYTKEQPSTLKLLPQFSIFPQFMFHLRRSAYLSVFNSSPDETATLRLLLLRAPCADSIIMIQPTLYSYSMQAEPQPVPLDSQSIQADNILLLDTFFEVLIHHGETIAAWRKEGYETNPDFAYFKDFLDVPRMDGEMLVNARYPTPRFIEVGKGDPDARILYNRINPSRNYSQDNQYGSTAELVVPTDDAPLSTYMEHLKKLAVSQ